MDQEVELHPARKRVRVRGIQVHGADVQQATAGQRTALNIAGADASELTRGMVLAEAGRFHATTHIDCSFDLLRSAKPLKHRAPVHFHAGAAVVEAEIRRLQGSDPIAPGSREYVRLVLSEPLLLLPGDRFIVRMFSPVITIGGGVVLDIAAPRRVSRGAQTDRLRILETAPLSQRIALLARESRYGIGMPELVARTGLLEADIRKAVRGCVTHRARVAAILAARSRMGGGQAGNVARAFEAVPSAESAAGWSLQRGAAQQVPARRASMVDGRAAGPFQDTSVRARKPSTFLLIRLR